MKNAPSTLRSRLDYREKVRDAAVALAEKVGPVEASRRVGLDYESLRRYLKGDCPSYPLAVRLAPKVGMKVP